MIIRKIQLNEVNGILKLYDEYERQQSPWPSKDRIESIFEELEKSGGCVIGAFTENGLVGTCTLNICPNLSWSGRPYAIIENVIVTKKQRNGGIGKAILKFARTKAEEMGCYKVALMTGSKKVETYQFYESAGFVGNKIGFQSRFNA